ncbi:MAG: mechanosensitive ion channel domain-containing protein, partial [Pseudomonadota bacterium]
WMDLNDIASTFAKAWQTWLASAVDAIKSPTFYSQIATIVVALVIAGLVSRASKKLRWFREPAGNSPVTRLRSGLYRARFMLFPLALVLTLLVATRLGENISHPVWLLRIAEGVALVYLIYTGISRLVTNGFIRFMGHWVGVPLALLAVFGWLGDVTAFLDSLKLPIGSESVNLSAYTLLRAFILGALLFWLGRASNSVGKETIRRQEQLDVGTREVFAKLFEIGVFVVIFLLLLRVVGVSLTALTVFGGALGVGLGFGLQQIASNFISGIILLLDRSVTIGDFVELEDGRSGTLRELNMRFGVLETYDGKDVVVPNEQFITSKYTNWTHKDPQQRYSIEFQVAYATDLDALFEDLRKLCQAHPQVLSGDAYPIEFQPDAEIAGFGDSGIDVLIEYWMNGVDDGPNRVGADLLLSIYHLFAKNDAYEFPFPQREVRLLGDEL